jgi:hypothetical protein
MAPTAELRPGSKVKGRSAAGWVLYSGTSRPGAAAMAQLGGEAGGVGDCSGEEGADGTR